MRVRVRVRVSVRVTVRVRVNLLGEGHVALVLLVAAHALPAQLVARLRDPAWLGLGSGLRVRVTLTLTLTPTLTLTLTVVADEELVHEHRVRVLLRRPGEPAWG